jgi:hypothetical protein
MRPCIRAPTDPCLIAGRDNTSSSATMTVPYYISENRSDMRGIKHGWYAIEDDGNLSSVTFSQFRGMPHGNQSAGERDDGA